MNFSIIYSHSKSQRIFTINQQITKQVQAKVLTLESHGTLWYYWGITKVSSMTKRAPPTKTRAPPMTTKASPKITGALHHKRRELGDPQQFRTFCPQQSFGFLMCYDAWLTYAACSSVSCGLWTRKRRRRCSILLKVRLANFVRPRSLP